MSLGYFANYRVRKKRFIAVSQREPTLGYDIIFIILGSYILTLSIKVTLYLMNSRLNLHTVNNG